MKIKTRIKAGLGGSNHSETVVRAQQREIRSPGRAERSMHSLDAFETGREWPDQPGNKKMLLESRLINEGEPNYEDQDAH